MKNLKAKDLLNILLKTKESMGTVEFNKLNIVLGNDEELNGVHEAYYAQLADDEEFEDEFEQIDYIKGKKFLIS